VLAGCVLSGSSEPEQALSTFRLLSESGWSLVPWQVVFSFWSCLHFLACTLLPASSDQQLWVKAFSCLESLWSSFLLCAFSASFFHLTSLTWPWACLDNPGWSPYLWSVGIKLYFILQSESPRNGNPIADLEFCSGVTRAQLLWLLLAHTVARVQGISFIVLMVLCVHFRVRDRDSMKVPSVFPFTVNKRDEVFSGMTWKVGKLRCRHVEGYAEVIQNQDKDLVIPTSRSWLFLSYHLLIHLIFH
jgi:hypothetical protein